MTEATCNRDATKMAEDKTNSVRKELEAVTLENDQLKMIHDEDRKILKENVRNLTLLTEERDQAIVDRDTIREEMHRQREQHVRAMADMMARVN